MNARNREGDVDGENIIEQGGLKGPEDVGDKALENEARGDVAEALLEDETPEVPAIPVDINKRVASFIDEALSENKLKSTLNSDVREFNDQLSRVNLIVKRLKAIEEGQINYGENDYYDVDDDLQVGSYRDWKSEDFLRLGQAMERVLSEREKNGRWNNKRTTKNPENRYDFEKKTAIPVDVDERVRWYVENQTGEPESDLGDIYMFQDISYQINSMANDLQAIEDGTMTEEESMDKTYYDLRTDLFRDWKKEDLRDLHEAMEGRIKKRKETGSWDETPKEKPPAKKKELNFGED